MQICQPTAKCIPAVLLNHATIVAVSICFLLTACGGGSGGGSTPTQTPTITSVAAVCSPASILTTQTSTCSATVQGTGSYSSAITWAASNGTITSSGVFTPTAAGTVTITATSTEDTAESGSASIVVGSATSNGEWTWMGGSSTVQLMANGFYGQSGVYGTLGVASSNNVPGGRMGAVSWLDGGGNLWLFGGNGYDSTGTLGTLNDLWRFSPTAKTWTWVSGSNMGTQDGSVHGTAGIYGTLGVPSAANGPGERDGAVSWTDSSGNLWLFGGAGYDSTGALGDLNDLWEFNPTTKEWTWMGGSNTEGAIGVYGTEGVPSASNIPGARYLSVSWTDKSGNFWLFSDGYANDLWEFNPTTKMWAWMSGSSDTMVNPSAPGIYGMQGVASASNIPGARQEAVSWTDSDGNLWLFGGEGGEGVGGFLNDLWQFSPTTKEWTWVSGSSTGNASGVYGTLGIASTSNVPGARWSSVSWTDSSGNLWLFAGTGLDSTETSGWLNDLWEFSPSTNEWTWMGGSNTTYANSAQDQADRGQPGVYGTEGVPSATNAPGGRFYATSWTDGSGNFWLFGGEGHDSTATQQGALNDLWRYQP